MPVSEKTRRSLHEFGLTDYEIRAYTALLETGRATASEISEVSEVPYSKIYEVLGSLEKKGWTEMEHGRPSKYYPKPPSIALEVTKLGLENRLRTNEQLVLEELQPLYEKKEVRERPDIWIVRGEYNILAKIRETLSTAQKEILAAIPALPGPVIETLAPSVKALTDKGVKVQVLTVGGQGSETLEKLSKVCELRVRSQLFGGGIIVDAREVILLLGAEGEEKTSLAIWSDHVGLARITKNYFEYTWADSKGFAPSQNTKQK